MKFSAVLLLFTGFASAADVPVTVVEEIVCKVNGDIISRTELEHDRRDAEAEFRKATQSDSGCSQKPFDWRS